MNEDSKPRPPHSEEFEKGVLGSILAGADYAMPICLRSGIHEGYFYIPRHQTVFTALRDMWDSQRPICDKSLEEVLADRHQLETIGGQAYVTHLGSFTSFSPLAVEHYLGTVTEKFQLREVMAICGDAVRSTTDYSPNAAGIIEALQDRIGRIGARGSSLPTIEDAAAIVETEIELPPDVIEGILNLGGKMVFGGGSKSFKTWQLADVATAVATGGDWLGHKTKKGRVLYVNLELAPNFFFRRLQRICRARGVKLDPEYLEVWNLRGHAASIADLMRALVRRRNGEPYVLIIIDPIYKFLGGREENAAGDIGQLHNEIERLAMRTGAAVMSGAHFSKGNQAAKESIDRISGSGVFARDPDSILIFTPHKEPDAFTVEATLRNHPPIEPFVVEWNFPRMQIVDELDPADLRKPGPKTQFTEEQLLKALDPTPPTTAEWQKRVGMTNGTFYRLLEKLDDKRAQKRGNLWFRL